MEMGKNIIFTLSYLRVDCIMARVFLAFYFPYKLCTLVFTLAFEVIQCRSVRNFFYDTYKTVI